MSLLDALLLESSRINVWIACRSDGIAGSGDITDPFDGSSYTKFDGLMNDAAKVPENSRVHLGPGIFETKGYCDDGSGGWQARPGIKIVGSGMDVTYLKLVGCANANQQYFAVGHALGSGGSAVDGFEICDLTVNCNIAGQTPNVAAGAVRIKGNHSRIRRIKATGWGSKTTSKSCYVLASITADAGATTPYVVDTVIDDCIIVDAAPGSTGAVIALHSGIVETARCFRNHSAKVPLSEIVLSMVARPI